MGKLREFEINFSQSQGVFHAGTSVSGHIVVDLSEPMKMRSITLLVTGNGKVHHKKVVSDDTVRHYRANENYMEDFARVFGAGLCLWLFGKGKVHWRKRKQSGKHHRWVDYRAEEIYVDDSVTLFGGCITTRIVGIGKVHFRKGNDESETHFRASEDYIDEYGKNFGSGSISLWIQGKGKVNWLRIKHRGKSTQYINYRAEEVYVNHTVRLFGSTQGEEIHPAGRHTYPFEFSLAASLPSSFEGEHGYVRYFCKATIDKPWKFDHDVKQPFTVLSILDLNREPGNLMSPMKGEDHSEVSCCCCVSGDVKATFLIDRRGYVPGENIYINAEVINDSNSTVNGSRVAIKQYIEFFGRSDSLFSSGDLKPKCESAIIAQKEQGEVGEHQTGKWDNVPLRIPAIPPSRLVGCNIINIAYVIKFYVDVSYGNCIKLASDLVIGTIPVHQPRPAGPGGGVISDQPVATAPLEDFAGASAPPPPSYEESVTGRRNIGEEHDSKYTRGTLDWAPYYPTYNLDGQYNTQYTDWANQPGAGNRV